MKKNLRSTRESFVRFKVKSEQERLLLENIKMLLRISGKSIMDGLVVDRVDDDNWALTIGSGDHKIQGVVVGDSGLGDYIRLILETPKDPAITIPICKKVRNVFEYLNAISRFKDLSIIHICIDKNENYGEDDEKEYKVKIVGNRFTFDFDFSKGDDTDFGLNERFVFRMF